MSKIEINNIYKIFGNNPDSVMDMVKNGTTVPVTVCATIDWAKKKLKQKSKKREVLFICLRLLSYKVKCTLKAPSSKASSVDSLTEYAQYLS